MKQINRTNSATKLRRARDQLSSSLESAVSLPRPETPLRPRPPELKPAPLREQQERSHRLKPPTLLLQAPPPEHQPLQRLPPLHRRWQERPLPQAKRWARDP